MKIIVSTIFALTAFTNITMAAPSEKLMREMEDYVRDLVRAHPEVIGDKKKKEYREDAVQSAGRDGVFELSESDAKKLRRRKELIKDTDYKKTLKEMQSLNSESPEITFLIKYAEQERIKAVEKLLAFRLMKRAYGQAAEEASNRLGTQMTAILNAYTQYKKEHNKAPASLSELNIPDNAKKFINSKGEKVDWIYIGHLGEVLRAEGSHIVLAAPEPTAGNRMCGMDNGKILPFKNSAIEKHLNEVVQNAQNGTLTPAGGNNLSSEALTAVMKKIDLYKDLNNENLPGSLDDLKIDDAHKNYTDPASGDKTPWIYLGSSSRIRVNENTKVIIVAPKEHQGKRLAGLSNGKIVTLDEKQIAQALK